MFTSLLFAQEATGEAALNTPQGGGIMGFLSSIIIIIIIFAILYITRRNSLIKSGKLEISESNEANKRILGIILTSLGGIAAIVFGLILSDVSNKFYLISEMRDRELMTYIILTGAGVITFIIGLTMILTSRLEGKVSQDKKETINKSYLTDLEKLEKLSELKDKGILTEEEFNIKKKKILDD